MVQFMFSASLVSRPLPDSISQLIFLHGCKIKSESGHETRLVQCSSVIVNYHATDKPRCSLKFGLNQWLSKSLWSLHSSVDVQC